MTGLSDRAVASLRDAADWPAVDAARYDVLELLGRGGMGTVYRTRDLALGREVALKVLGTGVARAEAHVLAGLEHPGIVPVHEGGTLADGRPYYTMKLVRGRRLDDAAAALALPELLRVLERVCEAVAFAHDRGVVHRDLKPANIMIGEFGEVLVMDWGLATRVTERVQIAGTPGFMPPEQQRGGPVDARSDVYALGASMARLFEGRDIPRRLLAIAARAAAADPEARYAGAAALAADLRRFAAGERVEAYREDPWERLGRIVTKYQAPIILVLVYLLVRVLLIVI